MVEWVVEIAQDPSTAWVTLCVVTLIALIEMVRSSGEALWGDFFAEELED